MNKLTAVLAIAGAILFAAPAVSQWARECVPIATMINIADSRPEVARHVVLRGEERVRALDFINSAPPQTQFDYATVVLVFMKDGKTGVLLMGDAENICHAYRMTRDVWFQLVEAAMGRVS